MPAVFICAGSPADRTYSGTSKTLHFTFISKKCIALYVLRNRRFAPVSLLQQTDDIVRHDIDPDFIKSFAISMTWAYADLYEELAAERDVVGDAACLEEFSRRRGGCATRALARAARQYGVPYE